MLDSESGYVKTPCDLADILWILHVPNLDPDYGRQDSEDGMQSKIKKLFALTIANYLRKVYANITTANNVRTHVQ